jgi:hypothetical protein
MKIVSVCAIPMSQPPDLARTLGREFGGDDLDVTVRQEHRLWVELMETALG